MTDEEKIERPSLEKPDINIEKPQEAKEKKDFDEKPDLQVEQAPESDQEKISEAKKEVSEEVDRSAGQAQAVGQVPAVSKEARAKKLESIMADGLEDIYMNLDPAKQAEFKQAGEETARKINDLLDKAKVNIKKVLDLLKKWLSILPGVNKFFIEQEAKLRADKITKVKE
ncbi:hypothetical protein GF382_00160 [Candidatus Falkowbacteria bacterium]|nr:hypothetical protein [Candidatus Falkowbacteria bacterium]